MLQYSEHISENENHFYRKETNIYMYIAQNIVVKKNIFLIENRSSEYFIWGFTKKEIEFS